MSADRIVDDYLDVWSMDIAIMDIAMDEIDADGKLLGNMKNASDAYADGDDYNAIAYLETAYDIAQNMYGRGMETDLIEALINRI